VVAMTATAVVMCACQPSVAPQFCKARCSGAGCLCGDMSPSGADYSLMYHGQACGTVCWLHTTSGVSQSTVVPLWLSAVVHVHGVSRPSTVVGAATLHCPLHCPSVPAS
jgi:hypothetical protein